MIQYEYLRFLNLQYWYCIAYSLFGGKCAVIDDGTGLVATSTPSVAPAPRVGFWEWLFGGGNGTYEGPLAFLVNGVAALFGFVGGIIAILWGIYSILAYTLSGILLLIITGAALGLLFIRYQELSLYSTLPPKPIQASNERSRWQALLDRAMSQQPKEWRESIIAADVMRGELLVRLGYNGAYTHTALRAVPEGAFVTLPNAWEAHRIRNFVFKGSSDYILTQREAFRVMKLYEQVFEEFDFI